MVIETGETRARVITVLEKIKDNGYSEDLQKCKTPEERRIKLLKFFPEINDWLQIAKTQLFVILQGQFGIFFEACQYLEADNHHQFCGKTGNMCTCGIPQKFCTIRDGEPQ